MGHPCVTKPHKMHFTLKPIALITRGQRRPGYLPNGMHCIVEMLLSIKDNHACDIES